MTAGRRNLLGIHALVWVGDTADDAVDLAVSRTAAAGYDLLEFSLHDLENLDVPRAAAALQAAGLAVVCSRGLAFDADVSSEDAEVVSRGAILLQESLAATVGLGGRIMTGALYSALGKYGHPLTPRGRENAVGVIRELAIEARDKGVTLGIEICNRYETNVVNTAAQALSLIDSIGEDNVMVHLDTYHMNIEEDDLVRPVLAAGDRLGYVHIGENPRGFLGSGHIDFPGFFHTLAEVNYTGPLTFESFSSAVVAAGLSASLAVWRDLWNDGEALARHAHQFMSTYLDVSGAGR